MQADEATPGDRPFITDEAVERLVGAFLAATLPKVGWTHRAHLAGGLWIVTRHGLDRARELMPEAIKRFNAATGTADTPTSGYHETITQFYLTVIDRFRRRTRRGSGLATQANELYDAFGDRELPLRHYSAGLLWSSEARLRWIRPDLAPIEELDTPTDRQINSS
jgi:hypothetical protein